MFKLKIISKIIFFLLKFITLLILFISAIGFSADKSISFTTSLIFSPILGLAFIILLSKWVFKPISHWDKKVKTARYLKNRSKLISDEIKKEVDILKNFSKQYRDNPVKPEIFSLKNTSNEINTNKSIHWEKSFDQSLAIVWADTPIEIEFTYRDAKNRRTRRKITLEEISVNNYFEPYFIGYCHNRNEIRHFKIRRISSRIKYAYKQYDVIEFMSDILKMDKNLINKLDNIITSTDF